MIERLLQALQHVEELSPEAQADLAQQIEDLTESSSDLPDAPSVATSDTMPQSVRDALALAGAWADLRDDDEFAALDHLRHESPPTPPTDAGLAWLDDDQQ